MKLDYTVRYHYANSGLYNPYLTAIGQGLASGATPEKGDSRYVYTDNPQNVYEGLVQNGMMIYSPRSENTVMARFELSKSLTSTTGWWDFTTGTTM